MSQEIKNALKKFDSVRFSENSANDIVKMNQIVEFGEHLINIGSSEDYLKDISPYAAYHMLEIYYQRARYHSHRGHFYNAKHTKDIKQSISDYIRFIELVPIAEKLGNQKNSYYSEKMGYEGLCDCYLEIKQVHNAIDIANQMAKNYNDAKSRLMRSKCYMESGLFDLAHSDIVYALQNPQTLGDTSEALELQNRLQRLIIENNFQSAININGNVSDSTIIIGNENTVQNTKK